MIVDPSKIRDHEVASASEISQRSTWINFLKDDVLPLLKEREINITICHSPIGFKNAKAWDNYINYLKKYGGSSGKRAPGAGGIN